MLRGLVIWIKQRRGVFPLRIADCQISAQATFVRPESLELGRWVYIGPQSFIESKGGVVIEDGAILSSRVTVLSSNHDYESADSVPYGGADVLRRVRIRKAAWIGYGALILPGVTIGVGGIVGAGAVVSKDVPDGAIVAGNPARVVKERTSADWRALVDAERFRLKSSVPFR